MPSIPPHLLRKLKASASATQTEDKKILPEATHPLPVLALTAVETFEKPQAPNGTMKPQTDDVMSFTTESAITKHIAALHVELDKTGGALCQDFAAREARLLAAKEKVEGDLRLLHETSRKTLEEFREVRKKAEDLKSKLRESETQRHGLSTLVGQAEQAAERAESRALKVENKLTQAQSDAEAFENATQKLQAKLTEVEDLLDAAEVKLQHGESEREALQTANQQCVLRLEKTQADLDTSEFNLKKSYDVRIEISGHLRAAEKERDEYVGRLENYQKQVKDMSAQIAIFQEVLSSPTTTDGTAQQEKISEFVRQLSEAKTTAEEYKRKYEACRKKLEFTVSGVALQSNDTKQDLMARAPPNPEGLMWVMRNSRAGSPASAFNSPVMRPNRYSTPQPKMSLSP